MTVYDNLINAQQLHNLPAKNTLILDVRHSLADFAQGRRLYAQSHLPNAHFIDIETDLSGEKTGQNGRHPLPDLDILAEKLRRLGMNQDTQVVAYDDAGGMMAARAWWLLRALGHTAVAVLNGGIAAWERAGFALTDERPAPNTDGNFQRGASLMRVLSANDVLTHLDSAEQLLIDARSPERYRGEVEPIDPIAGHIPGALNYFCADNLLGDFTFKSASELRTQWQALLGEAIDNHTDRVVHYCGSGITASHNLLSMHIAGLDVSANGAGLYAGSWSEWMTDPKRPRDPS